jgi:hypothetical protein
MTLFPVVMEACRSLLRRAGAFEPADITIYTSLAVVICEVSAVSAVRRSSHPPDPVTPRKRPVPSCVHLSAAMRSRRMCVSSYPRLPPDLDSGVPPWLCRGGRRAGADPAWTSPTVSSVYRARGWSRRNDPATRGYCHAYGCSVASLTVTRSSEDLMSEALQRHIGPMPTWLMFSGATIGIVGASVTKHAESVGEFVVALDIRADTSNLAAAAPGRWGLGLLIVGAVVALSGLVVAARVIECDGDLHGVRPQPRPGSQTRTPRSSAQPANPHLGWPGWQRRLRQRNV